MLGDYSVEMFTFVGRQRYMEPLAYHSLRCRPFVDKHALCIHTVNFKDLAYVKHLCKTYPDYFYPVDIGYQPGPVRYSQFYEHFTNANTLYVKLDDDVIWMQDGAVENLVRYKKSRPDLFIAFANTVNNGLCNHIHQRLGASVSPVKMPWNAYFVLDGSLNQDTIRHCADVHHSLLQNIKDNQLHKYAFSEFWLWERNVRFSINCLCMTGLDVYLMLPQFEQDRKANGNRPSADDEHLMSEVFPGLFGRDNSICGSALVAHFAFGPQQKYLLDNTDILDQYRKLAGLGPWRDVANE